MLNVAVCQHAPVGCATCEPLTTQAHDVVLKAEDCQHDRPVGAAACVPDTSQTHDVVLKAAVW